MTDDRTLLEKAARVAGYELADWQDPGANALWVFDAGRLINFAPLVDDGDAFRLASKSRILVDFSSCCAMSLRGPDDDWFGGLQDDERIGCSPDEFDGPAVTRRAIVRAAASLGSLDEEKQP
jgi:hypothetical protein